MRGKTRSEKTKAKISEARKGKNHSEVTKAKMSATMSAAYGAAIEVFDLETNISANYASLRAAARALNTNHSTIIKNINSKYQKPYKGRYIFKCI